jgi:hypothetical protein
MVVMCECSRIIQTINRLPKFFNINVSHPNVHLGGLRAGMSRCRFDFSDVHTPLHQLRSNAVPEDMKTDHLFYACLLGRCLPPRNWRSALPAPLSALRTLRCAHCASPTGPCGMSGHRSSTPAPPCAERLPRNPLCVTRPCHPAGAACASDPFKKNPSPL